MVDCGFTLGWLAGAWLKEKDIQVQTTLLLPIGFQCSYTADKAHVGGHESSNFNLTSNVSNIIYL